MKCPSFIMFLGQHSAMALSSLQIQIPKTSYYYISSKTQLQFSFNSNFFVFALRKSKRVSLSVRVMGSSASSQKPDSIQGLFLLTFYHIYICFYFLILFI